MRALWYSEVCRRTGRTRGGSRRRCTQLGAACRYIENTREMGALLRWRTLMARPDRDTGIVSVAFGRRCLSMAPMPTELQIAQLIAAGELPSPTSFFNSSLYALRFTGCGVAWRASRKEFVYRCPDIWLSDAMVERIRGVPVVDGHPPSGVIEPDTAIIGVVVLGFVEQEVEAELVARIVEREGQGLDIEQEVDQSQPCCWTISATST